MLIIDKIRQSDIDHLPEGWDLMIKNLIKSLNKYEDIYIVLHQAKEKFGGLRFYCHLSNEEDLVAAEKAKEIWHTIHFYEAMSYHLCIDCGAYKIGRDGYYSYCQEHMPSPKRSNW